MTTLTNQITIAAPRGAVWQALTGLDLLGQYDPGVRSSQLVGEQASGYAKPMEGGKMVASSLNLGVKSEEKSSDKKKSKKESEKSKENPQ